MTEPRRRSSTEVVFESVEDLHAQEQLVTRETIEAMTGLKLAIIDDRLSHLVDVGRVRRVQRGVYTPMTTHAPARLITRTILPDGGTVLEIGDCVVQLTPRESRMIGELMAGAGQQFAAIKLGESAHAIAADLAAKVRRLEREIAGSE